MKGCRCEMPTFLFVNNFGSFIFICYLYINKTNKDMKHINDLITKLSDLNKQIEFFKEMDLIPAVLIESNGHKNNLSYKNGKVVLVGMEKDCILSIGQHNEIILSTIGYEDWGEYIPCTNYWFEKLTDETINKIVRDMTY